MTYKNALAYILLLAMMPPFALADFEQDLSSVGRNLPALRELRARAVAGDANAQLEMGGVFCKGEDVEQDYAEGAKWFLMSARQGNAWAQFNLGMLYLAGQGVKPDNAESLHWYRLAALQGLAPAQINLGVAYATGVGVEKDEAEAAKWMRLAALQGDAQAQFNLGVMYTNGQGVEINYPEAHRWAESSAQQGHQTARALAQDLAVRMSGKPSHLAGKPPAASGDYYLQLAAFKSQKEAEKYLAEMRIKLGDIDKPFSIFSSDGWVRTQLGPYPGLEEARRNAKSLKASIGYEPLLKRH